MDEMELTCICCPIGCGLRATLEAGQVVRVTGNTWSPGGGVRPAGGRLAHAHGHQLRGRGGGVCARVVPVKTGPGCAEWTGSSR